MTKPIWLCKEEHHRNACGCADNLRGQLQQWKEDIVRKQPELTHAVIKPSIHTYPVYPCPYCGAACEPDMVDVGVGLVQCGPSYCLRCGASEIGPEILGPLELEWVEEVTGWYAPGKPVSPLANTFEGHLVNHKDAKLLYDRGLLDPKE